MKITIPLERTEAGYHVFLLTEAGRGPPLRPLLKEVLVEKAPCDVLAAHIACLMCPRPCLMSPRYGET